ncbi:MAG: hypothetical protein EOP87_15040 [Verrucomicrobiaceae bacterium]|nr:MAG: hypothetical protein EOP87_15040 [Verrucomicrobiaceae bacterium]
MGNRDRHDVQEKQRGTFDPALPDKRPLPSFPGWRRKPGSGPGAYLQTRSEGVRRQPESGESACVDGGVIVSDVLKMKTPLSTLGSLDQGESTYALLPKIYRELRSLAAMHLRNESGYQTLQPTALVHEAWVRISGNEDDTWKNNQHFLGVAAIVMRRILVERARCKATLKRKVPQQSFMEGPGLVADADHVIMIHECLTILEKTDPDSAKVVLLKFYGGFSNPEIATSTGWSIRTVERQWMLAKARLYRLICRTLEDGNDGNIR